MQTALIENVAREDLNPVDEARACAALVDELGLSKEELGRRIGRSRSAISNLIRLLDLPDPALELLEPASSARATAARCCRRRAPSSAPSSPAPPRARAGRCARPSAGRKGEGSPASEGRRPSRPGRDARARRGGARESARPRRPGHAPRAAGSAPSSASTTSTSCSSSPDEPPRSPPHGNASARALAAHARRRSRGRGASCSKPRTWREFVRARAARSSSRRRLARAT